MSYFKYLPPERIDVLENCSLRFTPFAELNDPFEAAPRATPPSAEHLSADFRERLHREAKVSHPHLSDQEIAPLVEKYHALKFPKFLAEIQKEEHWDAFPEQMQSKTSAEWGVLCLSEVDDNILMWSHYCAGHAGFAIGYDRRHHQFQGARPVIYKNRRPILRAKETTPDDEWYRTKSRDWVYEQEIRQFMELTKCDATKERPNQTPIRLLRIDPFSITSVTIGWRASQDLRMKISQILATGRYPNARFRIARPDRYEFKMAISDFQH
jgi:hypothetical protein